jgi:transcriptional regulator with XRE-family HTH domain
MSDKPSSGPSDGATLATVIRTHREAAGYSVRQLAAMVGIHHGYLARLETGDRGKPTADILQRLAEALEIDQDELLCFIGVKTLPEPRAYYRRAYKLTETQAAEAEARMDEVIADVRRKHRQNERPA